ncbi:rCG41798 [Rattus norvegicus]|uniref:RCG41798 n=1 Tax=Rattus norvegicus TaxID=10116 RepID=A6KT93_RAT|nr:rCG41798 [Rattus norvegicus]
MCYEPLTQNSRADCHPGSQSPSQTPHSILHVISVPVFA